MSKRYRFFDDDDDESLDDDDTPSLDGSFSSRPSKIRTEAANYNETKGSSSLHREGEISLISRSILHCDVDCFYCQCESLLDERKADDDPTKLYLNSRPFAIGQKHIIVTSNYIARDLGVKKLMTKEAALSVCPTLWIVDGSDLTLYRKDSRKIYLSFREALSHFHSEGTFKATKGGFDEMCADVSNLIANHRISEYAGAFVFVYGDGDSKVSLTEDQSGACVTVSIKSTSMQDIDGLHNDDLLKWGTQFLRLDCAKRLRMATHIASFVQQYIQENTGFTVSMGVSVSRFLAKIASDLKKPNSLNILFPWRTCKLIHSMPLRKIPGLGSRTMKRIQFYIESQSTLNLKSSSILTCREFLNIPKNDIKVSCFGNEREYDSINFIYDRCNGIDTTSVVDDGGKLPQTVSVENSHRRGTLTDEKLVYNSLGSLSERILSLIKERCDGSDKFLISYPNTLRLSIVHVKSGFRQRQSKQVTFDGRKMISLKQEGSQLDLIYKSSHPLLKSFLCDHSCIYIINVNLAVTNFFDLQSRNATSPKSKSLDLLFKPEKVKRSNLRPKMVQKAHLPSKKFWIQAHERKRPVEQTTNNKVAFDPEVLSYLPKDIANEVIVAHRIQSEHEKKQQILTKRRQKTITGFFRRKS